MVKSSKCPGLGTRSGLWYMLATSYPGQSVIEWFKTFGECEN